MGVRETSKASYKKLTDLGKRQRVVYEALQRIEPATDREIAKETGIDVHMVSPRRGELVGYGFVVQRGTKYDAHTDRDVCAWATTDPMAQRAIDRAAGKERHPVQDEPTEAQQLPANESQREEVLQKSGDDWVPATTIPLRMRREQIENRVRKIGIDSGHVYSDIRTYWDEDGYEANQQMVQ